MNRKILSENYDSKNRLDNNFNNSLSRFILNNIIRIQVRIELTEVEEEEIEFHRCLKG
jgi:hypothetical protein